MTGALLLSLSLFAADTVATDLRAPTAIALSAVQDAAVRIRLSGDGYYRPGEGVGAEVRTERDGYLLVVHVNPEGYLRVVFPLEPNDDNSVRSGRTYELVGRGEREAFVVQAGGRGTVIAVLSPGQFQFVPFASNGQWDQNALNPDVYESDPEPEVLDLVQRMGASDFDYDVANYDVALPTQVTTSDDGQTTIVNNYYDGYCGDCFGPQVSFGVSFGWGRPWWYYDPWYYDPWYWGPSFYPTYYPYRPYPGYYPGYPYYPYYPSRPFRPGPSPYEFKRGNRTWNGSSPAYRDRMYQDKFVNSVTGRFPPDGRIQRASFPGRQWDGMDPTEWPTRRTAPAANRPTPVRDTPQPSRTGGRRAEPSGAVRKWNGTQPVLLPDGKSPETGRTAPSTDRRRAEPRGDAQKWKGTQPVERRDAEPQRAAPAPERRRQGTAEKPSTERSEQPKSERIRRAEPDRSRPAPQAQPKRRESTERAAPSREPELRRRNEDGSRSAPQPKPKQNDRSWSGGSSRGDSPSARPGPSPSRGGGSSGGGMRAPSGGGGGGMRAPSGGGGGGGGGGGRRRG